MTRRCVTDEQYGQLWRRACELVRRVDEGTIFFTQAMDGLQALIESGFNPDSFILTVRYGAKLEALAEEGRYGYVNPDFTSVNFPTTRTGTVVLAGGRLVHFGRDMGTAAVEQELDEMSLRPGEPHELAEFGIELPDVQRQYPVVALGGKRWQDPGGSERVAYLDCWSGERRLGLGVVEGGWDDGCRFLAFPK